MIMSFLQQKLWYKHQSTQSTMLMIGESFVSHKTRHWAASCILVPHVVYCRFGGFSRHIATVLGFSM